MKHPTSCAYCQSEAGIYSPWGMSPEGWANMKIRHDADHKPDSPEGKKCNACGSKYPTHSRYCQFLDDKPETTQEKEEKLRKGAKRFAEDFTETIHELAHEKDYCECGGIGPHHCGPMIEEKDFIEEALNLFKEKFVRDDGLMDKYYTYGDAGMNSYEATMAEAIEDFLKEKLTEAMKEQKFEDNYENSKLSKKFTEMAYNNGRLSMKEETGRIILDMKNQWSLMMQEVDPVDVIDYILTIVRNIK